MEMYYARANPALKQSRRTLLRALITSVCASGRRSQAGSRRGIDQIIRDGSLERILKKWNLWNEAQVEMQASIVAGKKGDTICYDLTSVSFNWRQAISRLARAALVTVLLAFGP